MIMTKRLCFLAPNVAHAQQVVRNFVDNGIQEKHIYVLAKHDVELQDLPGAGPASNDFIEAYERGLAVGGVGGLFVGLLALAFPPAGMVVGGGAVLLIGAFGASLGGFMSGLAGASFPNSRLRDFEDAIDQGQILVMADVPSDRVEHYEQLIRTVDPDTEVMGVEPPTPIIP